MLRLAQASEVMVSLHRLQTFSPPKDQSLLYSPQPCLRVYNITNQALSPALFRDTERTTSHFEPLTGGQGVRRHERHVVEPPVSMMSLDVSQPIPVKRLILLLFPCLRVYYIETNQAFWISLSLHDKVQKSR